MDRLRPSGTRVRACFPSAERSEESKTQSVLSDGNDSRNTLELRCVCSCPQPVAGGCLPGRARGEAGPDACVSHPLPLCFCSSSYSAHAAYAQSKLALVLFTYRLQALLEATGSAVTANVADPGVVDTDLYRHVFWGTRLIITSLYFPKTKSQIPTDK